MGVTQVLNGLCKEPSIICMGEGNPYHMVGNFEGINFQCFRGSE